MASSSDLSERELEILCLVATGASNKEIAQKLVISTNTVKVHLRNIFAKIDVTSRTEAAMFAVKNGLVQQAIPLTDDENGALLFTPADIVGPEAQVIDFHPVEQSNWNSIALWVVFVLIALGFIIATLASPLIRPTATQPAVAGLTATQAPRWQAMAELPTPRFALALAAYENQVFALAGQGEQGVTGIVERYDPESDTWHKLADKITPVKEVDAAVIGGKIYVPGGLLASGEVTNILEVYDPRLDRWSRASPIPAALSGYALAAFEGHLFLFGGWNGRTYLDVVYEYDPDLDTWSVKTALPTARAYASAGVASGKIYVIGGYNGTGPLAVNEVYLPERDDGDGQPWGEAAPLPSGRYRMGVASVADVIDIVGGTDGGDEPLPSMEYQPLSDAWREFELPEPLPWKDLKMIPVGPRVYALGGQYRDVLATKNLSYQAVYTVVIPIIQ